VDTTTKMKTSLVKGFCLGFLLLSGLPLAAQPGASALVRVAVATEQELAPVTLVPGTVVSRSDARLSAEVEGRLTRVAEVGTRIKAGEALAEIQDQSLQLLQQELRAEIVRAEARLQFLEAELERFSSLAKSNLASANQYEQTRADRDVARGDLSVAQARLAQNQDQLSKTRVVAPFDGVVVERMMTPGERATEGSMILRLVDQQHLEVIARAPLEYYDYTNIGQLLEIRAGQKISLATVRTVVAVGDENTHLFELRLDLNGTPFPAGQTVRVAIPTSDSRDVLTVPRDALVLRPEGESIFIVDGNNQAQQVRVTTGIGSGADIEVTGAVSPGDRVIIRGNERLQPGQSVTIMDS